MSSSHRAEIVNARVSARLSSAMARARTHVGATTAPASTSSTTAIPPESIENAKIAAGGMIFALLAMSAVGLYFVTK